MVRDVPLYQSCSFFNIVQYSAVIAIIMHIAYSKANLKASHFLEKAFMDGIAICGGRSVKKTKQKDLFPSPCQHPTHHDLSMSEDTNSIEELARSTKSVTFG